MITRVPDKGIGFGILRKLKGVEFNIASCITFNYLGDFGSGIGSNESTSGFYFSTLPHGKEISDNRENESQLTFTGLQVEGKMRFSISYNRQQYKTETIGNLVTVFKRRLEVLADILSAEEEIHLTPVDLTYKGLTMEELELLGKR